MDTLAAATIRAALVVVASMASRSEFRSQSSR